MIPEPVAGGTIREYARIIRAGYPGELGMGFKEQRPWATDH